MKLTLKYSSFLFTTGVSLVKNITQDVDVTKLSAKDISILNAYIRSGAIYSDGGLIEESVEAAVEPVVEVVTEPVVEEVVEKDIVVDILDEPTAPVEEEVEKPKKATKKAAAKK